MTGEVDKENQANHNVADILGNQMKYCRLGPEDSSRDENLQEWSQQRFEILETIGGGAQSRVVKGRDTIDGSIYAIKIIDYNCNRKYADRELQIHKSLNSPQIVRLHGHYFHQDKPKTRLCLVLEYCPRTLLDVIKSKPEKRLSEREASVYTTQVVNGLMYLHQHLVMHRDIKLANILVSEDGQVKIADFGISASTKESNRRKTIIGTEGYMAPEIEINTAASAAGEAMMNKGKEDIDWISMVDLPIDEDLYDSQYDEKVDLWSLGAVLYFMITGNLSSCGDGETEYDSNLDFCFDCSPTIDFDFPDFVSFEAMDLVLSLLEEDPEARITLEQVSCHPWVMKHNPFSSAAKVHHLGHESTPNSQR